MQEAEGFGLFRGQAAPVPGRLLQHHIGPDDVGLHEGLGRLDGTVDVTFGGQVHHRVGLVGFEGMAHGATVGHVALDERIAVGALDLGQRGRTGRVGQFVEIDHRGARTDQMPAHRPADEAGAAGDQDLEL